MNIEEAFRIDGSQCLFNDTNLNNRISEIMPDEIEFGNLEWVGGVRDSTVEWVPNPNGRWMKAADWKPVSGVDVNICERRGELLFPTRDWQYAQGCDPYDHDVTESGQPSKAAALVKLKAYPRNMKSHLIGGYVLFYHNRPQTADIFYEDMIKQCVYTGAKLLFESQKVGILKYFRWRRYGQFMMHLAGYQEPGIPSTETNKQQGAEMVEALVEHNIASICFVPLCRDWLLFNIKKTKEFDPSMASLWTEWAAVSSMKSAPAPVEQTDDTDDDSLFEQYAIND
jgi:hypothetical protein